MRNAGQASEARLWDVDDFGSRMSESHLEYRAHGVEIWFGWRSEPVGGVRELLLVTSRDDLLDHDPELHALPVEAFADAGLPERLCPGAG